MIDLSIRPENAILAAVDTGEYDAEASIAELKELAATAGAEVVGVLIQRREAPVKATFFGSGRLAELAEEAKALSADLVIVDYKMNVRKVLLKGEVK